MSTKRTIIYYLSLASCFLLARSIYGQQGNPAPCTEVRQVTIATDSIKRKILSDYIGKCVREREFMNDKGILHLYEYRNSKNNLCWRVFPSIDDYYKDNPPTRFSDFEGDIVLVYEADSTGRPKQLGEEKHTINNCLEKIIGDRVYTRPIIKTRWTSDILPFINRKRSEGNRRIRTGGFEILIEFHKDNTYTISRMG